MFPHKYASLSDDKQEINGIELVRMPTQGAVIPVAVTWESAPSRIVVYWWNSVAIQWQSLTRQTTAANILGHSMARANDSHLSNRIAVVAMKDNVFLIYKREIEATTGEMISGLLIDWFEWASANNSLVLRTPNPIKVPVDEIFNDTGFHGVGYYLWAGFDYATKRLLVLCQTIRREESVKFVAPTDVIDFPTDDPRFYESEILEDLFGGTVPVDEIREEWEERKPFDPVKPGREPQIIDIVELHLLAADLDDTISDYAQHLSVSGNWLTPLKVGEGGYHFDALLSDAKLYCLYREKPYVLEVDNPSVFVPEATEPQRVEIHHDPSTDGPYAPLHMRGINLPTMALDNDLTLTNIPGGEAPQLHSIDPLVITIDRIKQGDILHIPETDGGYYYVPRQIYPHIDSFQKIYLRHEEDEWIKKLLFYFSLHPKSRMPATQHRYILKDTIAKYALLDGFIPTYLTDLTLGQTVQLTTGTYKSPETVNFLYHRAEWEALVISRYSFPPDNSTLNAEEVGYSIIDINHGQMPNHRNLTPQAVAENWQFRPYNANGTTVLDNTLGGALIVERSLPIINFFAYTDLGDGGCRVIYKEDFTPPEVPTREPIKGMSPDAVTGPGLGTDTWIHVIKSGWFDAELPGYHVGVDASAVLTGILLIPFLDPDTVEEMNLGAITDGSLGTGLQAMLDSLISLYHLQFSEEGDANPIVITQTKATLLEDILRVLPGELLPIGATLFDLLWGPHEFLNEQASEAETDYEITIDTADISFGKYEFHYVTTEDDRGITTIRERVEIKVTEHHDTQMRLMGNTMGQGAIDYRMPIKFVTGDISVIGQWANLVKIKKVDITLLYSRRYTPGILMSEQRRVDPMTLGITGDSGDGILAPPDDLIAEQSSVLSAKPFADTQLEIPSDGVKIDMSMFWLGFTFFASVISLLTSFGLTYIVAILVGLFTSATGAASSPITALIALILFAILLCIILLVVPGIVRREILKRIRKGLEKPKTKEDLDDWGFMTYAGEGVAEAIARLALKEEELPLDISGRPGRNRFHDQFWQTIFVTYNKLSVLVRK